ncbi:MAG: hypothetical protein GXY33_02130 [Phycisphaerae bacterium]|mgnify:CR=1 FL=1|nr:hypothetical protein [Phycisphaerae bacterium]
MAEKKRIVMEVDYADLAWHGFSREKLERFFEKTARAGMREMYWSVTCCGLAEYHSRIMPWYDGRDRRVGSRSCAATIHAYDGLAAAVELGKTYGVRIIPYFRMFDDYFSGMVDEYIDGLPGGWWESRCGHFQLRGWPSYWLDEVRDYKLRIVAEIASYGIDAMLFGLTRSHSLYVNPFRQPHFWGYNQPVADEFRRRHGVDIRKFDYIDHEVTSEGPFAWKDLMFVHRYNYVGAEAFDLPAWHALKGEYSIRFIREARKLLGPKPHVAIEASHFACLPFADPADEFPAKHTFDPAALAREGVIDEWTVSWNWRPGGFDFDRPLLPAFQPVLDAGAIITLWLNDFFSPTGGEFAKHVTPQDVETYLARVLESKFPSASIHEADFLLQNPHAEEIWKVFERMLG